MLTKICNEKRSKETLIGVAEVSFYNHAHVTTFKRKFIEIGFRQQQIIQLLGSVPVHQKFAKSSEKYLSGKCALGKFINFTLRMNDSLV